MNFTGPLEDRLAIRELCEQYCDGSITMDLAILSDCWAEDGEWVHPNATYKGRKAILQVVEKITEYFSPGVFFKNFGRILVNGDQGTGRCHMVEVWFTPPGPIWCMFQYDDEYVKQDGRWYFKRRTINIRRSGILPQPVPIPTTFAG